MDNIILETDRLLMRYQNHSDIPALVSIWSNQEVTKFIGAPREKDFLLNEFQKTAEDPDVEKYDLWVVIEKSSGNVVGHCGFIDKEIEKNTEIDLTYIFDPSAWGKGYGTEIAIALKNYAFNDLGLKRLVALIHPDNSASANIAKKIGMKNSKSIARPNGEFRDMFLIEE